jgi:hypothetical protein
MPEQPATLAEALIALQSRLPRITRDNTADVQTKTGRNYTYRYADLNSIHEAVFPLLAECGLCWVCTPTIWADRFVLTYRLTHAASTEYIEGWYPLPSSGGPQDIGSAITYARRYALTAVLGIAPADDDDGKAAQASYEERVAAGRMDRGQVREHNRLVRDTLADDKRAERVKGPAPDSAEWEVPDEDTPGSINAQQRARIMALFGKAGITDRQDRLAYAMSKLDLPELASSNDLSYRQALALIEHLEGE